MKGWLEFHEIDDSGTGAAWGDPLWLRAVKIVGVMVHTAPFSALTHSSLLLADQPYRPPIFESPEEVLAAIEKELK